MTGHQLLVALPDTCAPDRTLRRGDWIRVYRFLYWHHAIYLGNDRVVELGRGMFGGGTVAFASFANFACGTRAEVVQRGGEIAARRAESLVNRVRYNLLSANCEHFARWCVTGEWRSEQVRTAMSIALMVLLSSVLLRAAK
jgi:hypothetical protein